MAMFKIKIKKPKITLGDKDRGAIAGMGSGLVGAAIGNNYGDKLGKWSENQWNNITGKNAREANARAGREMERTRRDGIVREFGARQQADSLAYSAAMSGRSGGANNGAEGLVGGTGSQGTIGSNISSSGNF